jgi:hypothetical protein
MQYLTAGLAVNVRRCAEVLDSLLINLNQQTDISDKVIAWNEAGGNRQGSLEFPNRAVHDGARYGAR